ncbi:zinc-binding dehydrogenase, partial [Roseomonas sp. 18066]|uniref:zinc-dependent alcohol dehydrogenase n=1 Tax=Roseomonas sp. 18066 TaxID=2681412 RepID=UPI001356804F
PGPPAPGELAIRIAAAGICGSDIHAYEWTPGYEFMAPHMPFTLGHEFAGVVTNVGEGVTDFAVGDAVTAWPTIGCGTCRACREGRMQDCQARRILGLHCDGGFSSAVLAPAGNCFKLPEGVPVELGALAEPLTIAWNAVEVAGVQPGEAVLVLGPGPIGLAIAWMARQRGARVLLAGFNDKLRLDCAARMGLRALVDLSSTSLAAAVQAEYGEKVDRVIEATGVIASIAEGLAVLRSGGVFTIAGIHAAPFPLPVTEFVRNKQQLRAAHDTTRAAWPAVLALLADPAHRAELAQMVSAELPLAAALEGFETARQRGATKILLRPGDA